MKMIIDSTKCSGHGRCYSLAPDVFDSDDEGYGTLLTNEVVDSLRDQALVGVQNCPEGAISIEG